MRLYPVWHLVLALATHAIGADATPRVEPIRLPVSPTPPPIPAPQPVMSLAADQLYVIDADIACLILTSPAGLVSVTEDHGPVKIRGKFVDGMGKTECRSFQGKAVYTLEPLASGRVELFVVPTGGAAKDVIRRTLEVTVEDKPQPKPTPDPAPSPVNLWGFVIVEATAEAVAARGALLGDGALAAFMKSKSLHWRIVDKDVMGADGKPPADVLHCLNAARGKPLPQVLLIDTQGNIVTQTTLPNAGGLVDLLKKWGN